MSEVLVLSALIGGVSEKVIRTIADNLPQGQPSTNATPTILSDFSCWCTREKFIFSHGVFIYGKQHTEEVLVKLELVKSAAMVTSGIFLVDTTIKCKSRRSKKNKFYSLSHISIGLPAEVYCVPVHTGIDPTSAGGIITLRRIANEVRGFAIKYQGQTLIERREEVLAREQRRLERSKTHRSQPHPIRSREARLERFASLW